MDTIQREEKAEVARRKTSYCFLLETFERVRDDMRSGLESMKALVSSLYFLVFSLATRVISIGVSLVVESNTLSFSRLILKAIWCQFASSWSPKPPQNGSKLDPKSR